MDELEIALALSRKEAEEAQEIDDEETLLQLAISQSLAPSPLDLSPLLQNSSLSSSSSSPLSSSSSSLFSSSSSLFSSSLSSSSSSLPSSSLLPLSPPSDYFSQEEVGVGGLSQEEEEEEEKEEKGEKGEEEREEREKCLKREKEEERRRGGEELRESFSDEEGIVFNGSLSLSSDSAFSEEDGIFTTPYQTLTPQLIIKQQNDAIDEVRNVLGDTVPPFTIRTLLQFCKWRADDLLEQWMAGGDDGSQIMKKACLPPPPSSSSSFSSSSSSSSSSQDEFDCLICFETYPSNMALLSPCGHCFCRDCWQQSVLIDVESGKKEIKCPGQSGSYKCEMLIDHLTILDLLENQPKLKELFQKMVIEDYVVSNSRCTWCPAPGCSNAVKLLELSGEGNEAVECGCGHRYCFRCLAPDHRPCSCAAYQRWLYLSNEENLSQQLIQRTSRSCPSCSAQITKVSGCNHMQCSNCKFHFCWQCMGKFGNGSRGGSDGYSNHQCNSTKIKLPPGEKVEGTFYYERAKNHSSSLKHEEKLKEILVEVQGSLLLLGCTSNGIKFYEMGIRTLLENRNVLIYSYAFGHLREQFAPYVLKDLFEATQLDLERHTELLSSFFTLVPSPEDILAVRSQIIRQTSVAKRVREALLYKCSKWSAQDLSLN